jgi:hypothetical protein
MSSELAVVVNPLEINLIRNMAYKFAPGALHDAAGVQLEITPLVTPVTNTFPRLSAATP